MQENARNVSAFILQLNFYNIYNLYLIKNVV